LFGSTPNRVEFKVNVFFNYLLIFVVLICLSWFIDYFTQQSNTMSMVLLVAECLRQLDKSEEALRWLAKWLLADHSRLDSMAVPYDVYEQIPWTDWNTHWVQLYKDTCSNTDGFVNALSYL